MNNNETLSVIIFLVYIINDTHIIVYFVLFAK